MKASHENNSERDKEPNEGFLRRNKDVILVITCILFMFASFSAFLFLPKWFGPSHGSFTKYEVFDVIDGKSLRVHWLEREAGVYEGGNEISLRGIWSDKAQEPETHYNARLQFFRQKLSGQTIEAESELQVVDPNPPEPPDFGSNSYDEPRRPVTARMPVMVFRTPLKPSEVLLNDGSSLNQFLLANGYAAFDFTNDFLEKDDRARYEAAEAQARSARLGIWSSPDSVQKYVVARELFERKERLKRTGFGFYVLTQILLILVTAILMWISHKHYGSESFIAVSKLLAIPGALLLIAFVRLVWTTGALQSENPAVDRAYAAYLTMIFIVVFWGAKQFITLVAQGPLREWQTLWQSSQAKKAIRLFFIGLGVLIFVFALTYRLVGGVDSILASLKISLSQTLNLGYPFPKTSAIEKVVYAQNLSLWGWLLFCPAFVPNLKDEQSANLSLPKAIFITLVSLAVLVLVTASVFANIFYYNIHLDGFSRPLDLAECFFLALLTFIGKSYQDIYPTSGWMVLSQSLEVCIVLALKLVAFKFIFSRVKNAAEVRNISRGVDLTTTNGEPHT